MVCTALFVSAEMETIAFLNVNRPPMTPFTYGAKPRCKTSPECGAKIFANRGVRFPAVLVLEVGKSGERLVISRARIHVWENALKKKKKIGRLLLKIRYW